MYIYSQTRPKRFFSHATIAFFMLLCVTYITDVTAQPVTQPKVIEVTLPALGGLLHWVAPDITVDCLLPKGAEPHHFRLSARQLERVNRSYLLVRSSRDDLAWFKAHAIKSPRILDLWPQTEKGNNHAWLLPDDIERTLTPISHKLMHQFPEYTESISTRLPSLRQDVQNIRLAWQKIMKPLQQRGVIMQHAAWLPLFKTYQVPVLAVLEANNMGHSHGYNAKKLDQALQQLQQHPQALLIADLRHDNKGLTWLQRHHPSSKLIYLDAIGTCDQTWPLLMQHNIDLLTRALATDNHDR